MNLPTDLLRTFVAVVELGGFTRAGDQVGRSQPAVSLQVQRLEALVNKPLFLRDGRNLTLPDAGQQLFEAATKMLALNDAVVTDLVQPKVKGCVHMGIPNEFAASFLPGILRRFAQSHPKVEVQVTCDLSVNLLSRLQKHDFDLALALTPDSGAKSAICSWQDEVVWVAGPGPVIQGKDVLPLIVAPEGCVYRSRIIRALNGAGKAWRIAYTSPNYSGIHAGVRAGLGVTAVAKSTVPDDFETLGAAQRLPRLPDVEVGLHYDPTRLSPASQRLSEYISAHIAGAASQPS